MRIASLAYTASFALLIACGGPEASQANNVQANAGSTAAATAGAAAVAAASPLGKPVSGAQAKKIMHDRHEGMEDIGDAMKRVSAELKKDNPDLGTIRAAAATWSRYAPQVKGWYPPGTGPDVGKTRAKEQIWEKPADFRAKALAFERAVSTFSAAARGTNLAAIRAAHADIGKACKACHDPYRAPEDH